MSPKLAMSTALWPPRLTVSIFTVIPSSWKTTSFAEIDDNTVQACTAAADPLGEILGSQTALARKAKRLERGRRGRRRHLPRGDVWRHRRWRRRWCGRRVRGRPEGLSRLQLRLLQERRGHLPQPRPLYAG